MTKPRSFQCPKSLHCWRREVSLERIADFSAKIEAARRYDSENGERRNYWGELAIWSTRRVGELIRLGQEKEILAKQRRPEKNSHDATITLEQVGIPVDITRGTSISKVAAFLRGVLREHAESQRSGVIGHSCHVKPLFGEGPNALEKQTRDRIVKLCYFGQGIERASNDWHTSCDLVAILGTPRVSVPTIQDELIRVGEDRCRAPRAHLGTAALGRAD